MVLAWPVLAWLGIGMARHMKPALPNGGWFLLHRILVISSLFVTCLSFALIFIAFRNTDIRGLITLGEIVSVCCECYGVCHHMCAMQNRTGTAHFAIGIAVVILQLSNVSTKSFSITVYLLFDSLNSPSLLYSAVIQEQTSK